MDAQAILHELTHADGLPREALKAASAQRVDKLPLFLDEIETYFGLECEARTKPTPSLAGSAWIRRWRARY